ncbi:MAG: hypothetical protein N3A69_00775 [Leptospiraceae bacterium]|nr:hypothetical protein [Leptospiraceae bacterium]
MDAEAKTLLLKISEQLEKLTNNLESCHVSQESTASTLLLYLIPIFGIVFGTTLLFFIFYWWYKQRVELIRSGLYKPIQFNLRVYSFFLGLLLTFTGAVLSIVFIMVFGNSLAILGGLVPLAVGLSLLTFYKYQK